MNEMTIFNFNRKEVRTVMIESEPWWVAKDIADVLEYATAETMTRRLDDDEKTTTPFRGSGSNYQTNITLINESGLYNAIFSSKKSEAKVFKKWVTSEVLPSIRKTGKYDMVENLFVQSKTLESKLLSTKNATGYDLVKIRAIIYGFFVHEEMLLEHIKNKKAFKDFIRYLHTNPPLSTDDICKLLDISKSSFYRYKKMVEEVMPSIEPIIKIFKAYDEKDKLNIN